MRDPNEKVNGKGIEILRNAGIKVTELHEFEAEAKELNRGFVFVHKYQRPFVTLKAALSLDAKMCVSSGDSKWITGIEARKKAHEIRAVNDAVLVGIGTVLADDPELTVRYVDGVNPKRIILDSDLRTPPDAKIIGNDEKCFILTKSNDENKKSKLKDAGAKIIKKDLSVKNILSALVEIGVLNLMVEGGAGVLNSFLKSGVVDYVNFFYAPKILGEGKGLNDLEMKFNSVSGALSLREIKTEILGQDFLIEGRLSCSPDL